MKYKFEGILIKVADKDATFVEIPFDVEQEFGAKRVKVKAKFDGVDYRGSIVSMGQGGYIIGVTKAIRNQLGKGYGDSIFVEIDRDEEVREIELPTDFKDELEQNEQALKFYNNLSYSAKRKYYQWVTSDRKEETRKNRIKESIIKLESKIKL